MCADSVGWRARGGERARCRGHDARDVRLSSRSPRAPAAAAPRVCRRRRAALRHGSPRPLRAPLRDPTRGVAALSDGAFALAFAFPFHSIRLRSTPLASLSLLLAALCARVAPLLRSVYSAPLVARAILCDALYSGAIRRLVRMRAGNARRAAGDARRTRAAAVRQQLQDALPVRRRTRYALRYSCGMNYEYCTHARTSMGPASGSMRAQLLCTDDVYRAATAHISTSIISLDVRSSEQYEYTRSVYSYAYPIVRVLMFSAALLQALSHAVTYQLWTSMYKYHSLTFL